MIKKCHLDEIPITKTSCMWQNTSDITHLLAIGCSCVIQQLDSSMTSQIKTALDLLLLKNNRVESCEEFLSACEKTPSKL